MASTEAVQFVSTLMAKVDKQVRDILATLPGVSIAAQDDGTVVSNEHRILNFQGSGVAVTDDPINRRTNVLITGTPIGGATTTTTLLSANAAGKSLSLWNGSSNNSPPSNWETTGFNDSGWSAPVSAVNGGAPFGAPPGADTIWPTSSPASNTEQALFRHSFTLPAGTPSTATIQFTNDDQITHVYMNGTLLSIPGGATIPGGPPAASFSVPLTALAVGTNVLAVRSSNLVPVHAFIGYRLDVVQGGAGSAVTTLLGADVNLSTLNTYFDGPSISLGAGTWLVMATLQFDVTAGTAVTARLWDGTTTWASGADVRRTGTDSGVIALSAIITLSSTTTVKVSAASSANTGAKIRAAAPFNGVGNNATQINGVRIA